MASGLLATLTGAVALHSVAEAGIEILVRQEHPSMTNAACGCFRDQLGNARVDPPSVRARRATELLDHDLQDGSEQGNDPEHGMQGSEKGAEHVRSSPSETLGGTETWAKG